MPKETLDLTLTSNEEKTLIVTIETTRNPWKRNAKKLSQLTQIPRKKILNWLQKGNKSQVKQELKASKTLLHPPNILPDNFLTAIKTYWKNYEFTDDSVEIVGHLLLDQVIKLQIKSIDEQIIDFVSSASNPVHFGEICKFCESICDLTKNQIFGRLRSLRGTADTIKYQKKVIKGKAKPLLEKLGMCIYQNKEAYCMPDDPSNLNWFGRLEAMEQFKKWIKERMDKNKTVTNVDAIKNFVFVRGENKIRMNESILKFMRKRCQDYGIVVGNMVKGSDRPWGITLLE